VRILLAVHHDTDVDSGAAGTVMELGDAYRGAGHEVTFLSYDDFPVELPHAAKDLLFPELSAWKMQRLSSAVDVIDASNGDAWVWARLHRLLRRPRRPLLVTRSHGLEHIAAAARRREAREGRMELSWRYPLFYGGLRLWEVTQSLRLADLVFLLNEEEKAFMVENLGVAAERCHVVRNGLPDALIGLPPPTPEPDGSRIAMIGSFSHRKGVAYAMPALGGVLERRPEARLSMLGVGCPTAEVLSHLPAAVHERVRVVERYSRIELPALLAGHQVTLFPSLFEGFGKSILEAMACGLAPICTNIGGPTEFVADGVNGLVVPPRDVGAIEAALERLLGDRPTLEALRVSAHATAQEFAWKRVARDRLRLYERALG
jgi:glycosyltransferase involved in cell wall biosynthesis